MVENIWINSKGCSITVNHTLTHKEKKIIENKYKGTIIDKRCILHEDYKIIEQNGSIYIQVRLTEQLTELPTKKKK